MRRYPSVWASPQVTRTGTCLPEPATRHRFRVCRDCAAGMGIAPRLGGEACPVERSSGWGSPSRRPWS
jgi:hypothetical protein